MPGTRLVRVRTEGDEPAVRTSIYTNDKIMAAALDRATQFGLSRSHYIEKLILADLATVAPDVKSILG